MPLKYFAYGSNMSPRVIAHVCPSQRLLGPARLDDHRLAFTRKSTKWDGGVADISPAQGMTVWGVLYEIDESDLAALDEKEGYGRAYTRTHVNVLLESSEPCLATTYAVIRKESREIAPSPAYLTALIDGASSRRLPVIYVAFLRSLAAEEPHSFREGFLAQKTGWRLQAKGMNLVKVSKSVAESLGLGRMAVVVHGGKACLAKVAYLDSLDHHTCHLDQSIRDVLGMPGRESYGYSVSLHPLKGRMRGVPLVSPRSLVLSLMRPSKFDSEKNICVLHPKQIDLLGLREGEYVEIFGAMSDADGDYRIHKYTSRVFSGSADTILRGRERISYPRVDEAYVDLDGRLRLGIPTGATEVPVVVRPSVSRLIAGRALYYGIALFLSMDGVLALIQQIEPLLGISRVVSLCLAVLIAVLATLVFCIADIRGRVQY